MNEAKFWLSLEYRLCREFAGMPERRLQYLWCDGFFPMRYLLDEPQPRITGKTFIYNGPQQSEWEFALILKQPVGSRDKIDWASLLPPNNRTRWMGFDEERRYLEIEPAAAVPDPPNHPRKRRGGNEEVRR